MSRRNYEEIDIRDRRRDSEREIDFLREDYGRTSAGPLVIRDDRSDSIPSRSRATERARDRDVVERDEIIIARGSREPQRPRERELDREEITYRTQDRPIGRAVKREEIVYRAREPPAAPAPPQIAREREEFVFRQRPREPSYEREKITIREREREPEIERPRDRIYQEEEVIIRRDERERERERPRERDFQEEEIRIRREERPKEREKPKEKNYDEELIIKRDVRDRASSRVRDRSYDREEIIIRKDARERERQRPRASSFDREEISIRTEERDRPRPRSRGEVREEDIVIRRSEREKPRARSRDRREEEEIIIRREKKEREQPRERSWERSHRGSEEDIIIRHDENERRHKDEVIIRRKEPEPEPEYVPPPPPDPEPIRAPPIHQEIITHHRHIDHGFERAPMPIVPRPRSPSPKPRSPSPQPSFTEIDIRHRDSHNGRFHEDDIRIEHNSGGRPKDQDQRSTRPRSWSPAPRQAYSTRDDVAEEADYYNRRVSERAYIGEGYSGATKDWAIVDVPPGTSRVHMEGVGGASQDITWQRYNGVRRSKFVAEDDSFVGDTFKEMESESKHMKMVRSRDMDTRDRGRRFVAEKEDLMWTEITKDLVIKEAIEEMGYDYEETEFFFYVMVYLRYEDVLNLVEVTERIKRDRRARIREIEFERTAHPTYERRREPLALGWEEEKIYEREVIYDPPGSRRYR